MCMGYLSNSVFILRYVFHNLCTLITMLNETKFIILTLSTNYPTKFPYPLRSFVVYRIHSFGKKLVYFIVHNNEPQLEVEDNQNTDKFYPKAFVANQSINKNKNQRQNLINAQTFAEDRKNTHCLCNVTLYTLTRAT